MKRIFYYSGYRLTIFHWKNEKCVATYVFNPGEEGLDKFRTYLQATVNTPVRILVDLIEEDFNKESIPHVGPADRKSIVSRLVDRQYRKSKDYVHYKVIDREQSGRKDDILLYSVLSNPEILEPWIKPMQEAGTAISGIWSLPLLTSNLFNKIESKTNNILLVSQQVPSNLRQTFLKGGVFESSRSAVVNLDDASIGEYISTEVEQTIRFLSNQRHIGFDEKIEIHIICRDEDLTNIQSHCIDSSLRTFHYHNLAEIDSKLGCDTQSANQIIEHPQKQTVDQPLEYSNGIYSYVCASQLIPVGHYGNKSLFSNFYEQLSSKALYATSAIILLTATIFAFSYVSKSIILDQESITLREQAAGIDKQYQKHLAHLEHKLKNTQVMQSSVLLTEKIRSSKSISPQNFMVDISRILSRSGMHDTELTSINWQQNQSNDFKASQNLRNKIFVDYGNITPINQVAIIGGYIRVSQNSLKDSFNKAIAIADAFKSNKKISKVQINSLPVDVRSKSSIEVESSSNTEKAATSDRQNGRFEIQLIMQDRQS